MTVATAETPATDTPLDPSGEPPYVLLLGAPRSGTTLLSSVLGAHPDCAILFEDFFDRSRIVVGKRIKGNKLVTPNQIELTYSGSPGRRKPMIIVGQILYRLVSELPWFKSVQAISFGVHSVKSIRDYQDEYKTLKIIAVLRDPHDVLPSIQKRGGRSLPTATYRWLRTVEILYELRRNDTDGRVLIIDYDHLVTDTGRVAETMCQWLGIEFDPRMLGGHKYNPLYRYEKIDKNKAKQREAGRLEHAIFDSHPGLREKFNYLLENAI
jgi:hypothetical protein